MCVCMCARGHVHLWKSCLPEGVLLSWAWHDLCLVTFGGSPALSLLSLLYFRSTYLQQCPNTSVLLSRPSNNPVFSVIPEMSHLAQGQDGR